MSVGDKPLDRYTQRLSGAGIPVDIGDPEMVGRIDLDPETSRRGIDKLMRHIDDPDDEPVHHDTIDAEDRKEVATPCRGLDPDHVWYALGLGYCLIPGLDRSLFEVFRAAGAPSFEVLTHVADTPIFEVAGADVSSNPWMHTLQGIPRDLAERFERFVSSYRFKTGSPEELGDADMVWRLDWLRFPIKDPFRPPGKSCFVNAAAPFNLRTSRGIVIKKHPGLFLHAPVLGTALIGDDEEAKRYAL